jgi:hypothetical protein
MEEDNYPDADARFGHAPYFNCHDGEVKFDTNCCDFANNNYGSVSAFVPKFLPKKKAPHGAFCISQS